MTGKNDNRTTKCREKKENTAKSPN